MTEYQQQQLQRNKILAQTTESVVSKTVQAGAYLFKALLKFIQTMVAEILGK